MLFHITKVKRTDNYQENQSWRCNLCFDGIPDTVNETWEQTKYNVTRIYITTSDELTTPGRKPGPSWSNL